MARKPPPSLTPPLPEPNVPKRTGRPSVYTEDIAEELFRRIGGGEALNKICAYLELSPGAHPDSPPEPRPASDKFPDRATILRWITNDTPPGFYGKYTRACEARAEGWAEEVVAVSDEKDDYFGSRAVRVDARKWVASKLLRPRYGDRIDVDVLFKGIDVKNFPPDVLERWANGEDPIKVIAEALEKLQAADPKS